jgi:hypothetical protein
MKKAPTRQSKKTQIRQQKHRNPPPKKAQITITKKSVMQKKRRGRNTQAKAQGTLKKRQQERQKTPVKQGRKTPAKRRPDAAGDTVYRLSDTLPIQWQ